MEIILFWSYKNELLTIFLLRFKQEWSPLFFHQHNANHLWEFEATIFYCEKKIVSFFLIKVLSSSINCSYILRFKLKEEWWESKLFFGSKSSYDGQAYFFSQGFLTSLLDWSRWWKCLKNRFNPYHYYQTHLYH